MGVSVKSKLFKYLFLLLFFITISDAIYSENETDRLFSELNYVISQKAKFEADKKEQIKLLTIYLSNIENMNAAQQFSVFEKLHKAYFTFDYDSAMVYVIKMLDKANEIKNQSLITYAKIKLSSTLLASGIFNEAKETLSTISVNNLNDSIKLDFYYIYSRLYFDMADYYQKPFFTDKYNTVGLQYLDTAISIADHSAVEFYSLSGLKYVRIKDFTQAIENYEYLFKNFDLGGKQFAIDASTYGYALERSLKYDLSVKWLSKAAIQDIKLANKEIVALINLADVLFQEGNVVKSSEYLEVALDDAKSYGALQRKFQISQLQPIIEAAKLQNIENQKTLFKRYALLVTFLSIIIITILFILFKQLKKVRSAKDEIKKSNDALHVTNRKLREVNLIKEEYIGYFFKTNSDLIDKLEEYRQSIENKIVTRKLDELKSLISKKTIEQEREELFRIFDSVFLKIFPDFIQKYNDLFEEGDKVTFKSNDLLNTDLRIFALIRLGIYDTEKIAHILDYSVHTINTYKTKIKNKSIVQNDEFEKEILKIQSI
jgi:TPR repeat protein